MPKMEGNINANIVYVKCKSISTEVQSYQVTEVRQNNE